MGRKNVHDQSEIALHELGWKTLNERIQGTVCVTRQ